jgi:catechol 2,3-dioxygenase-like lactoylglutathione lyase family enzyme
VRARDNFKLNALGKRPMDRKVCQSIQVANSKKKSPAKSARCPEPLGLSYWLGPPVKMSPGAITAVSEIAFWVADLERAVHFYTERLGFAIQDIDPGRNAFLKSGDFLLVLFNPRDPGTALANEYLARTGRPQGDVYHVAFKVDPGRLDEMGQDLKSGGLSVKGPVDFATGRRSYFLEDPDAHYIELTDR